MIYRLVFLYYNLSYLYDIYIVLYDSIFDNCFIIEFKKKNYLVVCLFIL